MPAKKKVALKSKIVPNAIILSESDPRISQPSAIHINLYPHQLTMVASMLKVESDRSIQVKLAVGRNAKIEYYSKKSRHDDFDETFSTDILFDDLHSKLHINNAVLHDDVGHGKSITILALIASKLIPEYSGYTVVRDNMNCHVDITIDKICPVNIIVIPEHLSIQWVSELSNTDLKFIALLQESDLPSINNNSNKVMLDFTCDSLYYIDERKGHKALYDLNIRSIQSMFTSHDVILTTTSNYANITALMRQCGYYVFARVITDDIDHFEPKYNAAIFTWIVSATSVSFTDNDYNDIRHKYTYIRNNAEYAIKSINLPKPQLYLIKTALTDLVDCIREFIPIEAMRLINAGNMQEAVKHLNCGIETHESIIQVVNRRNHSDLGNAKKELEYTKSLDMTDAEKQAKVNAIIEKIAYIESNISHINNKIKDMMKDNCLICADTYNTPVITKCCSNVCCLQCLVKSLELSNGACPVCRLPTSSKDYTLIDLTSSGTISRSPIVIKNFDKLNKLDVLSSVLSTIFKTGSAKVIICSNYDETYNNIVKQQSSYNVSKLSGDAISIQKILDDFNKSNINILFLNSKQYGAGLNIPCTSHIILLHKMDGSTEAQVIGRAQRPNRKTPLKIIYLRDNNEPNVVNAVPIATEADLDLIC